MEINEAIEHTKNKPGVKVSFSGAMRADKSSGGQWIRGELSKHFKEAREAWLNGDLETVAAFFGLYV